jgi:protein involved in polysaccharide export with SLBB domain
LVIVFTAGILCPSEGLMAQEAAVGPKTVRATRQQLEGLRAHYEAAARSQAYSPELRARARDQADTVRRRLQEGDFRSGDWVIMTLEGEPALSDTFRVTGDRSLGLPAVGAVSLVGVLRSELESHLTRQIGRYINQPVVYARSYMRISFAGEVGTPGYHLMAAETPISEAIMLAGGPTVSAKLSNVQIHRGAEKIWSGEALQLAIREGWTLAELDLQDGDQVDVPRRSAFAAGEIGRTLVVVSSVAVGLAYLLR